MLLDGDAGHGDRRTPTPPTPGGGSRPRGWPREVLAGYSGPARTKDGHAVPVLANVQDGAGARAAVAAHAEGVGLFRTELSFLGHAQEPSVDEQATGYAEVLEAFAGRKVVLRTLDAGSDKPLAFATLPDEANPALGVRGLRIARRDPGMLDRQLDAVAEAARRTSSTPWVMAPMVATVAEAADFAARVRARGLVPGVMIEVPSAALHAERLLEHVDFLSIGTNDLSQYTLAADRLSADLADLTDPWQPALLMLVAMTAEAGTAHGQAGRASAGRRPPTRCWPACSSGWASPRCPAPRRRWRVSGPGWRRSTSTPVAGPPRPRSPRTTRRRHGPPCGRCSPA